MAFWCFLSNWLIFGLYFRTSQRLFPFCIQLNISSLKKMFNFSKFMFLENLAILLFQQFDKVIVSFTLGPSIAAIYSIGTSLSLRLSMVTGQVTEVMIPYASLRESLDDRVKLFLVFRKLSAYISLFLSGISGLLIIWMYDLLSIWISPDFAVSNTEGFRILIIAYGLLSLCRPAHQTLTGIGKVRFTALVLLLLNNSHVNWLILLIQSTWLYRCCCLKLNIITFIDFQCLYLCSV